MRNQMCGHGLAALGAAVFLVAGCGASGSDSGPGSGAPAPTTPPIVVPTATASGAGGAPPSGAGGAPAVPTGAGGAVAPPVSTTRPYDPDGSVTFTWPETVPGGGNPLCRAGRYVGTFDCGFVPTGTVDAGSGAPTQPFLVTGPVEFVLAEAQNGEFLEVSGGTLNGAAILIISFTAKISGKLDCHTGEFEGTVSDGSFGLPPPPPPLVPGPPWGYFAGPTSATYTPTGPALSNGAWAFDVMAADGSAMGTCTGTWNATFAP